MTSDVEPQATRDALLELLRDVSVAQSSQYFAGGEVKLIEAPPDFRLGQVLKTHIAMVLLTCAELRILFKVHFNYEQVRTYRKSQGSADGMLTDKNLVDFIKEFCNQAAGQVSRIFNANGFPMGISIPLCTRGIYEIYADYQTKEGTGTKFGDFWRIEGAFQSLYCSCYIELMSKVDLSQIKYTNEQEQSGDLEFL